MCLQYQHCAFLRCLCRHILSLQLSINTGVHVKNDTWLVTGSSVGLGRAIVEEALAAGCNVVATARNPAVLDDLVSRFPERFLAERLDVTDGARARDGVVAGVVGFGRMWGSAPRPKGRCSDDSQPRRPRRDARAHTRRRGFL